MATTYEVHVAMSDGQSIRHRYTEERKAAAALMTFLNAGFVAEAYSVERTLLVPFKSYTCDVALVPWTPGLAFAGEGGRDGDGSRIGDPAVSQPGL
ncbi:hypothetical protein [Paludisphaera rhizosphaerae]|uniref:hypothetical protein n=1 Tax=Paludisphaera rhizosphaerae TaxID=2711216 RepID=UPI0013EBD189|nr:hypothetical protein [Paludisphaera rhizosphaerae]